jgi:general stress protein YciG
VNTAIQKYLSEIGRKGGQKSRRTLTPEQARAMVEAREKKKKATSKPKTAEPSRERESPAS